MSEPTQLGPWLIDSRDADDPWMFHCHNGRTQQRALVEVHFADNIAYGDALRTAAMDMDDPDWKAIGSSRLVLRPGEGWDDQPAGNFIFWVAWEDSQPAPVAAPPPTPAPMAQPERAAQPNPREATYSRYTEESSSPFALLRANPLLLVLGLVAVALVAFLLVTQVFSKKSDSTAGLATLADGSKAVACGSGPINLNQGDHASIPLNKASLGSYQLKEAVAGPVSKAAAPEGLKAVVGADSTLMLDAAMVPGQGGRVDEYKVALSLTHGSTNVVSNCQVLVKAPATPPSPTPLPVTPTVVATAVAATYTVVSGDSLTGIAIKQNIPADQRTAWLQQVRTLNNISGDKIDIGQVLKLPPKP